MSALIVGIDVSKDTVDVARITGPDTTSDLGNFPNDETGFRAVAKLLKREAKQAGAEQICIIVEPTGGYERLLVTFAIKQDWRVSIPNPFKVRQWAKGMGIRAKTDRLDARMLARYGASKPLPTYKPLPEHIAQLDALLRRKEDLEATLRGERNRLHACHAQGITSGPVFASIERTIAWLEQELEKLHQEIDSFLDQHPDVQEQATNLRTVPGIGERNCLYILVLLYRWDTLTDGRGSNKQLTAYVGLDPVACDSGTSVHGRQAISREGNRNIRCRLYMSALGATNGKNALSVFYHRLVAANKKKKVALVAGARKIIIWAWAVFRRHTTFDAQRFAPAPAQ